MPSKSGALMPNKIWVYKCENWKGEEFFGADDWESRLIKTTQYHNTQALIEWLEGEKIPGATTEFYVGANAAIETVIAKLKSEGE